MIDDTNLQKILLAEAPTHKKQPNVWATARKEVSLYAKIKNKNNKI